MDNKRFISVTVPIIVILFVLILVTTIAMNANSSTMDTYLGGKGARQVINIEGTEGWDLDYYGANEMTPEKAKSEGDKVSADVIAEGSILLKNNGTLPLDKSSEVTPLGYSYLYPTYTGNGSAATYPKTYFSTENALSEYFIINRAAENKMKAATPIKLKEAEGTLPLGSSNTTYNADNSIIEYDAGIYNSITEDLAGTAAVVFISRVGGEGNDKKYDGYEDGTPHYLALSEAEKQTIKYAKDSCDSVTVILMTANIIELAPIMSGEYEADAILWVGIPGAHGLASLGKILCGDINPSGKTVDIWTTDFTKDPTFQNIGEFYYSNATFVCTSLAEQTGDTVNRYFIEYEEGIYQGYRYYETAHNIDNDFKYGALDKYGGVKEAGAVAYPFGYGLSYTKFKQSITHFSDSGDYIDITIKVDNIGGFAGKDVVQIYYTPTYTEYDKYNYIEKASANLVAFSKTKDIPAGESEEIKISFSKEEMASYSFSKDNSDGTYGCYLLEAGNYEISLRSDSHQIIEKETITINNNIWFDNKNPRQTEKLAQSALDADGNSLGYPAKAVSGDISASYISATNHFEDCNEYMQSASVTNLSRKNWSGTFPTMPENRTAIASESLKADFDAAEKFDYNTDPELGNVQSSKVYSDVRPASGEKNSLTLADMRGLDYYDKNWEELLNQIDFDKEKDQIQTLLYAAAFTTEKLDSIGKPETADADGVMGITMRRIDTTSYPMPTIFASTWNVELAYKVGVAFGQEALAGVNGFYGPAMNLHRSPFSGRNYEYYSEDPLLSGKIAAALVSGCGDKGLYCYIKHFALNDQETNRHMYLSTWANEQTIRELYLKPFEICVKEATMTIKYVADENGAITKKTMRASTALMSAQNCIGTTIGFAHYGLLTGVLRHEWGFTGGVITDLYMVVDTWLKDKMTRAGGDMFLFFWYLMYPAGDYDSATAQMLMRESIHRIGYMTTNSNVMNGAAPGAIIVYGWSPWAIGLLIANIIVYAIILTLISSIVYRLIVAHKYSKT